MESSKAANAPAKATTQHTPFLMPYQVNALAANSFEIRDAAEHPICVVGTHASVVEREKLVRMFAAAPEMRAALVAFVAMTEYVANKRGVCVTSKHLFLDDEDAANMEMMITDARALLARIDGTEPTVADRCLCTEHNKGVYRRCTRDAGHTGNHNMGSWCLR